MKARFLNRAFLLQPVTIKIFTQTKTFIGV